LSIHFRTIYDNFGPVLYRLRDIATFIGRKSRNFLYPTCYV